MTTQKKWLRLLCAAIAVIVPITRMYLGVHSPADVLVGSAMAIGLLLILKPVCFNHDGKYIPRLFLGMAALAFAFLAYVELFPFPADVDLENLESARTNAYTLLGTMLGMTAVYFLDEKKLRFCVEAQWFAQVGKVVGGLILVLLIKEGLKAPLEAIFNGHLICRSVRYGLIVLVAGGVWPLTFPWFSKIGRKDPL